MYTLWLVGGILILLLVKKPLFHERIDASSSSSSVTKECDSSSGWDYEVFLSFRGEETPTNFTDHLYHALRDKGIHTFRDNEELLIGEEINEALRSAIHQSKIAIIIFSKDYASSKWCLRELGEIAKCMNKKKEENQRQILKVMPVFYHVLPSDVRNQTGSYGNAFRDHKKKFNRRTVDEWKKALRKVGGLKGWDLENTADGFELTKPGFGFLGKFRRRGCLERAQESEDLPLREGRNEKPGTHNTWKKGKMMKFLNLASKDRKIVGIHGLGGIGKTTVASFRTRGAVHLQSQLVTNILNIENPNITSVDQGIDVIKRRLSNKNVFIVLDDVDENTDLNAIIGEHDWFGFGSKIIITTRNKHILNLLEVDGTYEPGEMDSDQSLKLFSKHAFKMDLPPENYLDLSKDVVKIAGGLPLALEVLGSYLFRKEESAWKGTVKKLAKIPNNEVQEKLRISYVGLSYEEKEMFLDIACFFIGKEKNIAFYIWKGCDFFPDDGIVNLCQKALVKIGEENELSMHDQLRDLGREIVRQENLEELEGRSRLWSDEDVMEVLSTQKGTSKVKGLCITFPEWGNSQPMIIEGFGAMTGLRLLQVDYAKVARNFEHPFPELRWLSWKRCPTQFTPINLRKLCVLDLSHSDITENWMGWNYIEEATNLEVLYLDDCPNLMKIPTTINALTSLESLGLGNCPHLQCIPHLPSGLKSLKVCDCENLREILGFSDLRNLERLRIRNCSKLEKIESLEGLDSLQLFEMWGCHSLRILPKLQGCKNLQCLEFSDDGLSEIEGLEGLYSMEKLSIGYCKLLRIIPNLSDSKNLVSIEIQHCDVLSEIEGLEGLDSLEKLSISKCPSLRKIQLPKKLCELDIGWCDKLSEIKSLEDLESLTKFSLWDCNSLIRLPDLSNMKTLKDLSFDDLPLEINCFEGLESLEELWISGSKSFIVLPDVSPLKNLKRLSLFESEKSINILSVGRLESLEELSVKRCKSMEILPNFLNLTKIERLEIEDCEKVTEIQGADRLEILEVLCIDGCISIETLPCLSNLKNLRILHADGCKKLIEIQGMDELESLGELYINGCISIERLPCLSNLKNLRVLHANGCKKLTEIQGVDELEFLGQFVVISGCISIERLPCLSNFKKLKRLTAYNCKKLTEIQGLDELESLKELCIDRCISIERLPCLSNLKNLKTLRAVGCEKLTEIQGVEELEVFLLEFYEAKFIKLIVTKVWGELQKNPLTGSDDMMVGGMDYHVEKMMKLMFEKLAQQGELSIYKSQLLTNILNLENPNITSVGQGIDTIKQRLFNKKVLIVLDDVDRDTNLNEIIGKGDWFGIGSKIIITTRDKHIFDVLGGVEPYEPNVMDPDQSLQLFSKHAFKMDQPPKKYWKLSRDVVNTTGGLPLALQVIGSYLCCMEESAWTDAVKKLGNTPHKTVQEKLRISYDGLDHDEQQMFLDIACFFIGKKKNIPFYIWKGCDFFPELGIEILCQKSLVKIDEKNELWMHDQLRDLGREIVRQENHEEVEGRSRLWSKKDVVEVLSTQKGTKKVKGLCGKYSSRLIIEGFGEMSGLSYKALSCSDDQMTKVGMVKVSAATLMAAKCQDAIVTKEVEHKHLEYVISSAIKPLRDDC
ncbi:disease resistance protein L6-like [Telopea speciosissima]|uniref:disease resistance protein L6-like n=1 Tax=Telopea speciosissima TaxID=54955 RepID=UPI001CC45568|nr:disease resistance protein L6-like [Telopea speciosissima]